MPEKCAIDVTGDSQVDDLKHRLLLSIDTCIYHAKILFFSVQILGQKIHNFKMDVTRYCGKGMSELLSVLYCVIK